MRNGLGIAAAAAAVAMLTPGALAQGADRLSPNKLEWKEIAPGVHFGASHGDWEKGAHGKYARFVKNVQIPMHRHSHEYHALVVSGRVVNLLEGGVRVELEPGDYFHMAARRAHSHECLSDGGCLLYAYASDRWDYVPYEASAETGAGGNPDRQD